VEVAMRDRPRQDRTPGDPLPRIRTDSPAAQVARMVALQRSAGNRAVSAMVARQAPPVQRLVEPGKFNIVGEVHDESKLRRQDERAMAEDLGFPRESYWEEYEFQYERAGKVRPGDDPRLRTLDAAAEVAFRLRSADTYCSWTLAILTDVQIDYTVLKEYVKGLRKRLFLTLKHGLELKVESLKVSLTDERNRSLRTAAGKLVHGIAAGAPEYRRQLREDARLVTTAPSTLQSTLTDLQKRIDIWKTYLALIFQEQGYGDDLPESSLNFETELEKVTVDRSSHMYKVAKAAATKGGMTGVWKVGDRHLKDMGGLVKHDRVVLTSRDQFNEQYENSKTPSKVPAADRKA
jgi:hypothetical protein